jgi:hypothetical protein
MVYGGTSPNRTVTAPQTACFRFDNTSPQSGQDTVYRFDCN